jgi:hypothetical protein
LTTEFHFDPFEPYYNDKAFNFTSMNSSNLHPEARGHESRLYWEVFLLGGKYGKISGLMYQFG